MLLLPPAQVAAIPSQEPLNLDLAGALSRARTENPQLRAAKAKISERQGLITATRADAMPQLTLVGDFTRLRDVSILNSNMGGAIAQMGMQLDQLVAPAQTYTAGFKAGSVVMGQYCAWPGTQAVPANGTRAMAAASTVSATRSSGSRLCRCDLPQARAMVCASSTSTRR